MSSQNEKQDPFTADLEKQQQRRAQSIRGIAFLLVLEGLGASIYALILWLSAYTSDKQHAVMLIALVLGLASIVAGSIILWRAWKGEGGTGFDDVVNNVAPRIFGGEDPNKLDQHRRRGKRRPRLRR